MKPIKVGIQLASLKLPFKQALHTAARLGADGVEIDVRNLLKPREVSGTGLRQVRKMLDELNLRVCAVGFPTRRGYDVPDDIQRRVEATKEALKFAFELGARVVVNHVGPVPSDENSPQWQLLCETLNDIGRYGQHVGATLAAETGTESGQDLARLIERLEPGALGVNFDPGSLIVNGYSAREAVDALARYTLHVHATDGVTDRARGRGIETPLGRGSVDLAEMLAVFEEHRYSGFYTIERQLASDPVTEVGQAVQYLRAIVQS